MSDLAEIRSAWPRSRAGTVSGNVESAGQPFRHALELDEAALGLEHPEIAHTFNNLGHLLAGCERAEAQLLRRAIGTLERSLSAAHPYLAAVRALARAGY